MTEDITSGLRRDLPFDAYLNSPGISSSQLKTLALATPMDYWYQHRSGLCQRIETPAMQLGTLVHCLVLEGEDAFHRRYCRKIKADDFPDALRTVEQLRNTCRDLDLPVSGSKRELIARLAKHAPGVQVYDTLAENQKGVRQRIVNADLYDTACAIATQVGRHEAAARLLETGEPEVSCYGVNEASELAIRCRCDWLRIANGIVLDLKTTKSVASGEFSRTFYRLGYHLQEALYTDCLRSNKVKVRAFAFLAVQTEPPHHVRLFCQDEESRALANKQYNQSMCRLADCIAHDQWPGYGKDIETLVMPNWIREFAA